MSFLDRIKLTKSASIDTIEKKPNPLLVKKDAVSTNEENVIPKINPLLAKRSIIANKNTLQVKETTSNIEESITSTDKTLEQDIISKNELSQETTEESTDEAVKEEIVEEKTIEEPVVETEQKTEEIIKAKKESIAEIEQEIEEESIAETEQEEFKSGKKRGRKARNKRVDKTDIPEDVTELPESTLSFSEAAEALSSPIIDEEWINFKNAIEEELNSITIDMDMNPGTLKVVLAELNTVYDKIAQPLYQTKTLLENLTNKEDGIIQVIKSVNTGSGNNDTERKKAGYIAAMAYKPRNSDGIINLFDAAAETRSRYNFLKCIYDRIQYKNNMLITMNGALKLERDFTAVS